ncbi:orotidine-5'-phosphate decarboxylase [bacterium]|nr:orotidine-5'-phosphate decarboxylase [bacterium]
MKAKLIVALDVETEARARELVDTLREVVTVFKVGSQLFTRIGPRIVEAIHAVGAQCFLDLKFHDIPNTVAKAIESAGALGVRMVTIHTLGGEEMLRAAAQRFAGRPLLLGVTVLTSTGGDVQAEVVRRAQLAQACGLDGVVASAREIGPLRQALGPEMLIVTPGIRPAGAVAGDQKRVMTPGEAVRAGADYLVVGRPIVEAAEPVTAARQILQEMGAAQ